MIVRYPGAITTAVAVAAATAVAQQPGATSRFDVVSIKQNKSGETTGNFRVSPSGRFEMTNFKAPSW